MGKKEKTTTGENLTYITDINCICLCQNNLGDIRHDMDFGLVSLPCLFVEVLESLKKKEKKERKRNQWKLIFKNF